MVDSNSHRRRQLLIGAHNEMLPVAVVCVQNPDGLPLGIAREVWKRHAKAFLWVRPLAGSVRIARAPAELDMMTQIECDEVIHSVLDVIYADAPYTVIQRELAANVTPRRQCIARVFGPAWRRC
jgi:hypothetical protein